MRETDQGIDHVTVVARAMTAGEPRVELEARIKHALDTVTTPRRHRSAFVWVAGAGTVAAALIVTLVVQGPGVQGPGFGSTVPHLPISSTPNLPTSTSPHLPSSPSPQLIASAPVVERSSVPVTPTRPAVSEAEAAWMSRRIAALEPVEALDVDRLTFESIQPQALTITPLTMTPLTVSPVSGNDGGSSR